MLANLEVEWAPTSPLWAEILPQIRHEFWLTIKARLIVKNKTISNKNNVHPRDPPPGNGRPHYSSQLSDMGFICKVYSLMVTSSQIWLTFISPILNVPNLKLLFPVENSAISSKQVKIFFPVDLGLDFSRKLDQSQMDCCPVGFFSVFSVIFTTIGDRLVCMSQARHIKTTVS